MTFQNFTFEIDADGIALITWNMPGRSMNVIDAKVMEELAAIVERVATDAAVKGAVLTSGKEAFCAGADLSMLETQSRTFAELRKSKGEEGANKFLFEESRKLSQIARRMETCGKPWVAAINGTAMGGGWSWRWLAIIASHATTTRRGWAYPKSRSVCFRAAAARNASRACCSRPTHCNSCSRAISFASTAPKR